MDTLEKKKYSSNIWKMYFVRFFFWMHFVSAIIVPFYTKWGGVPFAYILFLNAWFMFCIFIFEIPTGTVADFWGRKQSITLAGLVGTIAFIVYGIYPSLLNFIAGEFLFAIAFTLTSGADEAMVYDSLIEIGEEKRSKKIFARMESSKMAGIFTGALMGSLLAKLIGLQMTWLLQAVPMSVCFFIAFTMYEPKEHQKKKKDPYFKILKSGMAYFFKHKILILLASDMIVIAGLSYLIIWFYQALLGEVGVDIVYFGIVHSFMSLGQILIIENFIVLEKLFKSKRAVLFFSAFVAGAFYIVLGLVRFVPLVIGSILIVASFGLSREPLFANYMNKYIPSDKRATVLSTTSMMKTITIVFIYILAGFLSKWSYQKSMIVVGVIIVIFSFLSRIQEEHLID
ncbi:MAG: MFS transporter [Acidobacteria bacterium]|nr:MFS transporter [Acidobacteriota bacterium]